MNKTSIRAGVKVMQPLGWIALLLSSLESPVFGGDPPTTNNGVIYFQGNQSTGVNYGVSNSPATMFVTNLNTAITPPLFSSGIQMIGSDPARNFTLNFDGSAPISTSGIGAYGIHVENLGGFAGTYDVVTNSFTIITNVVNGTNVVTVITNIDSGSTNQYATLIPAGGVTVNNRGNITTSGPLSHGIFAESPSGSITFTLPGFPNYTQAYGNGGPVNVANSGDITTGGALSHGILAQSLGGLGPEDSGTSGNGGDVAVTTLGGNITTSGNGSLGIFAQSVGGDNTGGESGGAAGNGDSGGSGGNGGNINVTGFGNITNHADNAGGIFALSLAGNGGNGGNGGTLGGSGGSGGSGGKGSSVLINGVWNIDTFGTNASGMVAESIGGHGGDGGDGSHFIDLGGGNGGGTGDGGTVSVTSGGNIHTRGDFSLGIFARSLGGYAGNGGNSYNPFYANAGDGNSAGAGQNVSVANSGNITTEGNESQAIYALSVGGGGGVGGNGGALAALGSTGGAGGNGSNVVVTNFGALTTFGKDSHGIEAQSIGGGGGDGGNAGGFVGIGGNGSQGSTGGIVKVFNTGGITNFGGDSDAILAQSIGGGGGNAGSGTGAAALGGTGDGGGNSAAVQVFNSGNLSSTGTNSFGIFAQSIGGGGGSGGGGSGLAGIGGKGGLASQGDVVTIFNSGSILSSAGAIFAQSIGGGGGNGGNGGGWFSVGGYGGPGGNSAAVTVTNFGDLQTGETNSSALLAQSIGGGGGNGGNSTSVGAFGSLAIGGKGGAAGNGDVVQVTSGSNFIATFGNNSYGIDAESIGGGGGNGGYAAAGSVGDGFSAAVGIGGDGGGGGYASNVTVASASGISTFGTNSHGIFAQSIGGGGGAGGFSIAVTGSSGAAVSLSMGGNGGSGNRGGTVFVTSTGAIVTAADHSYGILAQSVGGGGGDGGFAFSGAFSADGSAPFSFGGTGGTGGDSGTVTLLNSGPVATRGDDAHAVVAQSIGGGGGSGGFSIAGAISAGGTLGASFGGSGNGGGSSSNVLLVNQGTINTFGARSDGIMAQSVGGGGGNGGFSVSGSISKSPALSLSLGGSGAGGGNAGTVTVTNNGSITTRGEDSHGLFAQSLGGGGGAGGFSVAASISQGASAALSIGGGGGGGGHADAVTVDNTGEIITMSNHAYGILAQSVGGGGGDGGFSVAGDVGKGSGVAFSMGGAGGSGNYGGEVTLHNTGNITTYGALSYGIFAQSLGGGGGSGGFSVAGQLSQDASGAAFSIGGAGGPGVDGAAVKLANSGNILTTNVGSHAIFAESVGGGGGAGGFAGSLSGNFGDNTSVAVAIGGNGAGGGSGSTVNLTNTGLLQTRGDGSSGIFAQSIGGGGGDGGFGLAAAFGTGQKAVAASLAIGGNGGAGGTASNVTVWNSGEIDTFGTNSHGIFAQSVGGGGGDGGFAASGAIGAGTNATQLSVSIGGNGSNGNLGGMVFVTNSGQIMTQGTNAIGIFAQSIGGGGGAGGMSFAGTISSGSKKNLSLSVGGTGGTGGDASFVQVTNTGTIVTTGDGGHGIFAQSVGGGGGAGGLAAAMDLSIGSTNKNYQFAVSIGGSGGVGGKGSDVLVNGSNAIVTMGGSAYGVFAQSVGGGGGAGGFSLAATGVLAAQQGTNRALTFAVGGSGGNGNNAGAVTVDRSGVIETFGDGSYGILAQSIGGGGGDGGSARSFSLFTKGGGAEDTNTKSQSINISIGGTNGGGSSGGMVIVTNVGDITTHGADAYGIFAQSVGGGGGSGGSAHSSTDELIPLPIPGLGDQIQKVLTTDADTYQVVVGGSGGSGGNGDHVIVNNTGNITTFSDGSYGIFAQSVGAGGGVGGNGGLGQDGLLAVGGSGGASGAGGAVDVTVHGNVFTAGAGSAGIFAQSVGGGGGVAGDVDRGVDDLGLGISKGFAFGRNGGSSGNGGAVTVNTTGTITTAGNGADGIFAQSVGGGGGVVGDLGNDVPVLSTLTDFAGSVGGSGSGGNVTVSHAGNIFTYGTNSAGIFAQSAGGTNGVGGAIQVSLTGSIFAQGADSDGIFAQSGGGGTVGNGDVNVTVTSNSVVQGGSGSSVGVHFMDGVNNTLENRGAVTTLNGVRGLGVAGTGGNDIVNNHGLVVGSVDLGAGGNSFNNFTNATLMSGTVINLGTGNALANAGTVALGDTATVLQTALTGNFQQTSNGSLQVKLAAVTNYDVLSVSGAAALDGNLSVYRFNSYLPVKGNEFTVLTAGSVSNQFATLSDPYKGNYALRLNPLYSAGNVMLQVVQDSFSQFATTPNQRSLSSNLDTFSGLGTTNGDPRGAVLIAFLNTQSSNQLPADLDLIAPEELGAMFDLNFAAVNLAVGNLQQRMREIRAGNHGVSASLSVLDPRNPIQLASAGDGLPPMRLAPADPEWGVFASGNGQYVDVAGTANAAGYHFHSGGVTLGVDKLVDRGLAAGFTLDYSGTRASLVNNGSVDVDGGRAGVYGTWFEDNSFVEGSLGGGYNHYNSTRAALGGTASGTTDGSEADAMLGFEHDFACGQFAFGPFANGQYTFVRINGFTETGSLAPLQLQDNNSQSLLTRLGIGAGYDWKLTGVTLRPALHVAWQHELLDDDRAIDSRLASGAGNVFQVTSPQFGRDSVSLDAGITAQWSPNVSSFLSYHGDLARQGYEAHNISGGFSLRF